MSCGMDAVVHRARRHEHEQAHILLLHGNLCTGVHSSDSSSCVLRFVYNYENKVLQLWKRIKYLKNLQDGDSTFAETSVRVSSPR
jgi:hypothetical protein